MPRFFVIMNPNAGDGSSVSTVEAWARERTDVQIVATERQGDGTRCARLALESGAETIVVVGGDGTLSEVVNGLDKIEPGTKLGLVPAGTGNDFARTAGIPFDPEAALAAIEGGVTRPVDLIQLDNSTRPYSINAVSGGITGEITANLEVRYKRLLGPAAYGLAMFKSLRHIQWHNVVIEADGERFTARTFLIVVGNGRFIGGGVAASPEASLEDGKADLTVITVRSFWERMKLSLLYFARWHHRSKYTIFRQAQMISIDARPPMTFNVDGEPAARTPLTLRCLQGRLSLLYDPEEIKPSLMEEIMGEKVD